MFYQHTYLAIFSDNEPDLDVIVSSDDEVDVSDEIGVPESDTDSEDDAQDSLFSQHDAITKGTWDFYYDKTLYSSGLAVQILPGSDLTILQWLVMNFHLFSNHPSMSKAAFNDSLLLQKRVNKGADLPASYYEAKQMVKPYLVKKITFDVCENDCIVYRNSPKYTYAHLKQCPVCGKDRYVPVNDAATRPVCKRRFDYIPLGPRLARIYGEENLAKIVQSHPGSRNELLEKDNNMWDIHNAPKWKDLYSETVFF